VGDRKILNAKLSDNWQTEITFSQVKSDTEGGIVQKDTELLYYNEEYLVEGEDYTIQYKNNTKVGTATVIFTGKGRYTGTLKKTYKITPNTNLEIENPTAFYVKGGVNVELDLLDKTYGTYTLKYKTEYSLSVKYNKNTQKATCTITGIGNYKGYKKVIELDVALGDISRASVIVSDKLYSTKENAWKSTVTLKDINGKALTAGVDYDRNIVYDYEGIEQGIVPQAGTVINVTINGINNYAGSSIIAKYHIYNASITKLIFVIDTQEYTGEEITLTENDIHVYAAKLDVLKGKELNESCYEIVSYSNNIKVGTATVTLRGIGNYSGTKAYSFKIKQKQYVEFEEDNKPTGEYLTPQMFKYNSDKDDTASFNRAINSLSGTCNTLYVPDGEYYVDAEAKIWLKSNMKLIMSKNAKIKALGNSNTGYDIIELDGVKNVTISGGQIIGERYKHSGSEGEWGMGIGVYDSTNITISNVTISDCWGDGIYLGSFNEDNPQASSKYITIENCTLKNNRRNNLSIVCADYVTVNNCNFDDANGTDPQFGICIEPNFDTNPNEHITISNSTFNDNAVAALGIITISNDISINNCIFNGDVINYAGTNVSISNCTINGELYARYAVTIDEDTTINGNTTKLDKLVASYNAVQGVLKKDNSGYYLSGLATLKKNKTYRFVYVIKGSGTWKFKTSHTGAYDCITNSSDTFKTGYVTMQSISNGDCTIRFDSTSASGDSNIEIESIKIYEVN
jgi:hypothetical protein